MTCNLVCISHTNIVCIIHTRSLRCLVCDESKHNAKSLMLDASEVTGGFFDGCVGSWNKSLVFGDSFLAQGLHLKSHQRCCSWD